MTTPNDTAAAAAADEIVNFDCEYRHPTAEQLTAIIAKHYAPLLSEVRAYLEQIQGNDPEQNRQEADVIANRALAAIDAALARETKG